MKVVMLYQFFVMNQDAGSTRPYELGRRLAQQGHSVTIITGNSIYFTGEAASAIRFLWKRETIEGIDIIRMRIPFGGSRGILRRIIGFLWFIPVSFAAALTVSAPDVVMASSVPLTIGIPAVLFARLKCIPFVFELRDLWPDCVVAWKVVQNRVVIRAAYWLESFLYGQASLIIALTEGIREELIAKGIKPQKVRLITNASDLQLFSPEGSRADLHSLASVPPSSFVCIHAGSMGRAYALETVVKAAVELQDENIHFVFMGSGPYKGNLIQEVTSRGLRNVHFLDPVSKSEVPSYLRTSDLGLVIIRPGPLSHIFLPNKFFDNLACGCPVILNTDGEARRLLESADAGVYVPSNDASALAKAIRALADSPQKMAKMRRNARRLAEQMFSWDQKAFELLEVLTSVEVRRRPELKYQYVRYRSIKRMVDLAISVIALIILAIPMFLIALIIKATSPGPIFFRQQRAGLHGRLFTLIKFRTMVEARDAAGYLLSDSKRITRFGRFLRSTSLDEVPELLNVIRGEMSLVGPRPFLARYLPYYSHRESLRHSVLPGLTGWAQINGRNSLCWDDRLAFDVWYVENWSLLLDARILWKTPSAVFSRRGVTLIAEALDIARGAPACSIKDASTCHLEREFSRSRAN